MAGRVEDSGTESSEEKQGGEEVALQEVRDALVKLREALPKLTRFLGGSISDLIGKLQNVIPEQSQSRSSNRRHQRRYHTVGVSAEDVAKAKDWIRQKSLPDRQEIIRMRFEPIDYKAGCFMEPAPQAGVLSFVPPSSPFSDGRPSTDEPREFVSTYPRELHNDSEERNSNELLYRRDSLAKMSSSDEEVPKQQLVLLPAERKPHIKRKAKRSNTLEVPKPSNYDDIQDTVSADEMTYSSDHSDTRRNTYLNGKDLTTPNDHLTSYQYTSTQDDPSQGKPVFYNPSARGGKHWSNRFSKIKTTFEERSSDEKECISPILKIPPAPEKKASWIEKFKEDMAPTNIAQNAWGIINQFTHNPLSRFKPVEKRNVVTTNFPASVSGTVKQLATQKFSSDKPPGKPDIERVPSFTQRAVAKLKPKKQRQSIPQSNESQPFIPKAIVTQYPIHNASSNHYPNGRGSFDASVNSNEYPIESKGPVFSKSRIAYNCDYDRKRMQYRGLPPEPPERDSSQYIAKPNFIPFYPKNAAKENARPPFEHISPIKSYNLIRDDMKSTKLNSSTPDPRSRNGQRIVDDATLPVQGNVFYNNTRFNGDGSYSPYEPKEMTNLVVGRIMGEAQKKNVAVINPLVRSMSGMLPPKNPKSTTETSNAFAQSRKHIIAQLQPKMLHKSESCHQLMAQYAFPGPQDSLNLPKQQRLTPSPKPSLNNQNETAALSQFVIQTNCDIISDHSYENETDENENVEEEFENIFKQSSSK